MVEEGQEECARGAASQQIVGNLVFLEKVKVESERRKGWDEFKSCTMHNAHCVVTCLFLMSGNFKRVNGINQT